MLRGQLYCMGRPQGQTLWAETEGELHEQAEAYITQLKQDFGENFKYIFTDKFELRIK